MVVLAFQLFVLFNAITAVNKTHGELSFHDGNNNRNIVREVEKSNQMIPAAASQGIADTTSRSDPNNILSTLLTCKAFKKTIVDVEMAWEILTLHSSPQLNITKI
ncbi:unnamed protein product [Cercopithifilaria johnstoni]|uniref:Uncharacterized protein n=1 Tax=Cercopithifilaria johnstoni TaxID=2874296 RepID=A0A8J2M4Q5_9BILA|nr:unnamed protein product [Cercopithifilaria johnstoni]